MSEGPSEGKVRSNGVHEVEHVDLASLVLVLNVTVFEALLQAELSLGHFVVRAIHHEHTIEETAEGQRVLALHHK